VLPLLLVLVLLLAFVFGRLAHSVQQPVGSCQRLQV
jgi:flagellar biogenesis protein FliO